ncbi:MAG TPA: M56 family metallopeptidase [Candidatus Sulfotelmatobacter sp.]|nr:M56 family metallopeptidase [Candidatus Sulfotelmatobacter sp.]
MNVTTSLTELFEWLLNRSWQAGVLVLCVLLIQWIGRRWLTNRWRFALWWIVLARLLLPFGPASELSLFNCFRFQNVPGHAEAWTPNPGGQSGHAEAWTPNSAGEPPDDSGLQKLSQPIRPPMQEMSANTPAADGVSSSTGSLPTATVENLSHGLKAGIPETVLAIAIGVWLAGVILFSVLVAMQVLGLTRRLAKSATRPDARACDILRDCCRELRIRRNIELLETDAVDSPALFGLFRLRLLLPRGLATGFDRSELRYIFLHELAHVRRGDLWINCLATGLQILHWFNPLIWLGFARLRADRELACDEQALQHTGETAAEAYGMTIIKLLKGLQRPAAIPGLVGILEDRNQMRRRILRIAGFKKATRWSALAVLLLPGLGLVALTDAQQDKTPRPNLTGVVVEADSGDPVQGTVFIYTAGPRVGTSSFCPSCYADCQKSAKADEDGNFTIKSLDPQLIFQVLAVAPGYKPKFVSKVDPVKGPITIKLAPISLASAPPGNCLHGRVVDTNGEPIAGAVVEMHGIRDYSGGGGWGRLDGVDPLAVTDNKGEFLITSLKPFDMMDVRVSARGYANKGFIKLASGSEVHELTLTQGASITGRILFNGKPLANVDVGIVTDDRTMDATWVNTDIGTGPDGRFLLVNVPPDLDVDIFATMKSLAPYGAIPARIIHTGGDGSTTDAGDMTVTPGYRLAGRVVLADGKPLPPKIRLLIGRNKAWDSIQISLPPDGRFDLSNVPAETYDLNVRVPGYYMSPKNGSYDVLNPGSIVGRVDGDTTNLTFLLERGKAPPPQEYGIDESEWPQNRALEGVGANEQADHSQDWIVSGRVTDARTGEPLKQFTATPGNQDQTWSPIHWDERDAVNCSNGDYTIYVDKRYDQPFIKVEADGYLPQSVTVTPLEQTNADFAMHTGTGPSGMVLGTDGKPAANADVLLLCADTQNPNLRYDGHLMTGWPREDGLMLTTGPDGRFAFQPRLGMESVAAASPDGYARVPIACLATNPNITLQAYGSIEGTLKRPKGPGANEDLDLEFAGPDSVGKHIFISNGAHTDSSGHFKFTHVPPGDLQVSYRVSTGENGGWQSIPLQQIMVAPGQALNLHIDAPARQAVQRFGTPMPAPEQIAGANITGTAVLPDGTPAADAQVGLEIKGQFLTLGKASIISYNGWRDGYVAHADSDGKFTLPMYKDADSVIVVSDNGFARVSVDALKQSPRVVVQPWAKIEGTLLVSGRHPGANRLIALRDWGGLMGPPMLNFDWDAFRAKTDTKGQFVLTYIPPGTHHVDLELPEGNGWTSDPLGVVEFKAGETERMTFGGNGRTVIGRVKVGKGAPADWKQGHLYLQTVSAFEAKFKDARTREERMKIMQSPAYQKEMMNMHNYPAALSPDGSFKAEDVVPGKYGLSINFFNQGPIPMAAMPATMTNLITERQLTVPKEMGTNDVPVDLGTIDLKTVITPTFISSRTNRLASVER